MEKHRWFAVLLIFMLSSCTSFQAPNVPKAPTLQPASPNPITTKTATLTSHQEIKIEALPTGTPSGENKTTSTATVSTEKSTPPAIGSTHNLNIDIISLSSLAQFKYYILYDKDDEIHALSMDGTEDRVIGTGKGILQSVTYDGKILGTSGHEVEKWEFFDFDTHQSETKSVLTPQLEPGNCRFGAVSPDQKWATILCSNDGEQLFLENLDNHRVITVPGNPSLFFSWYWSADGRWLIYIKNTVNLFPGKYGNGTGEIMLVDVSCLDSSDSCPLKTYGPYFLKSEPILGMGPEMASPDGRYYAFPTGTYVAPIITFDLRNKSFSKINVGENINGIYGMAWSPDGKWIACSLGDEGISLVSVKDGKIIRLIDSHEEIIVFGWLSTFPRPVFQIKNALFITGAGDNLIVRVTPSIKSAIVNKLYSDDQVQIIDGPIMADHFTWWKILVLKDQSKGWVVEVPDWYATSKK